MIVKESVNWYFPPTKNRNGVARKDYDIKKVMIIETELFNEPVIAMSDIHSHTPELVVMLDEFVNLDQFVVLTAGDMAGEHIMGTDGIPTTEYEYLSRRAKEFYFVQGNHDLPDHENKQDTIKNKQNQNAMIQNGTSVNSLIGTIGGMNGIISGKYHPYKMSWGKYNKLLQKTLSKKSYILMTHDTPSINKFYENSTDRYIGSIELFDLVDKWKPKIHLYGHCHHPTFHNLINGVNYINLDAKVLIFIKPAKIDGLFKKNICDVYSPNVLKLYGTNEEYDDYDTI